MKLLPIARSFFKTFDLFSASQFLRFQEEGDYKTVSGGICSLMVMIVFAVLFMNTAIQTVNMDLISWNSAKELLFDPQATEVKVDPTKNHFMFAVGILGVDLNNVTHRYFDVDIVEVAYAHGNSIVKNNSVRMVPCTKEHFSVNEEIKVSYDSIPAKEWMCPPIGYAFSVSGKYTSNLMELLQIRVMKCSNSLDLTRPCVPNTTIAFLQSMVGQFIFTFYYANPLINPGDKGYLSYYLEDKNYVTFTTELGAYSNGFIEDFTIETDVSLLPFSDTVKDEGIIIPDLFQTIAYQVTTDQYACFYLMKSSSSTSFQRSFNKLDSFFSYVGGLVGTILGFMLIVQNFTEMSFELTLSEKLFTYSENPPNRTFDHFSFFTYIKYRCYELLSCFGFCKDWKAMRQYQKCRQEIVKQLDIQLLLHRIDFLERAIDTVFNQSQVYGLHLQKIDTLRKIKKRRRRYAMRGKENSHVRISNESQQTEENNSKESDSSQESDESKEEHKKVNLRQFDKQKRDNQGFITLKSKIQAQKSDFIFPEIDKMRKQKKRRQKREQIEKLKKQKEQGNEISSKIVLGLNSGVVQENSQFEILHMDDFIMLQRPERQKDIQESSYRPNLQNS